MATYVPEQIPFAIPVASDATYARPDAECVAASASAGAGEHITSYVRDHTPAKQRWSIKCSRCCVTDIYCGPGKCESCDRLRASWIDNYY